MSRYIVDIYRLFIVDIYRLFIVFARARWLVSELCVNRWTGAAKGTPYRLDY